MSKLHDRIKDYINWSVSITLGVSFFLLSKDKLFKIYEQNQVHGILSIALLATTVLLYVLYLRAVRIEIDLIDAAFDTDFVKKASGFVLFEAIALGLLFGSLIYECTDIMYFTGIAAIYSAVDMYGQATVIRNINIFIKESRIRYPFGKEESEILFDYYIKKPLLSKIALTLVSFCFALVLSVIAHYTNNDMLEYLAYGLVILTIIVGEVFIHVWRHSRDTKLLQSECKKSSKSVNTVVKQQGQPLKQNLRPALKPGRPKS